MAMSPTDLRFGSSRAAPRSEDDPLLAGRGRFTDDLKSANHARAVFVRSPMGHAAIRGVDAAAAAKMPGVLAVITGAQLAIDGLGAIPPGVLLPGRDGKPMFATAMPALAHERVLYVGVHNWSLYNGGCRALHNGQLQPPREPKTSAPNGR